MKYKIDNIKNFSKRRGWVCGCFYPVNSKKHRKDIEVKYGVMKKGSVYPKHKHPKGREITILIQGRANFYLNDKKHLLKTGDVLYLDPGVEEEVHVLEDATYVSIRTPSVKNNKKII